MNRALLSLSAMLSVIAAGCDKPTGSAGPAPAAFKPVFSSDPEKVRAFFAAGEGGKSKLAFIDLTGDTGILCYVDFSEEDAPKIRRIAAAGDARVPVISPDGSWIAYASGPGAEAGSPVTARSSVYLVRMDENAVPMLLAKDSACEPRFTQQAGDGKLALVYSTLAPNLGWEGFGSTLKLTLDVSGAVPVKITVETLAVGGSYTGGLSSDGRYVFGGGGHVARLDLRTPGAQPETLSHNLVQSCNASASSSRIFTDALMYLNFPQDSDPHIDGGKPWGDWQAILIGGGSPRKLLKAFIAPREFGHDPETSPPSLSGVKWHHNEWSNHPYFAAAALNADRYFPDGNGFVNTNFQERIYFINLKDSTYLEAMRPEKIAFAGRSFGGFFWPFLWVEIPAGFREETDWLASGP
jgi:hypothetical protein